MTTTPSTLAEINNAIVRGETQIARHRLHLADCAAAERNVVTARELVRLVEKRLAMLRERRQIVEATEGRGESGGRQRP
jgi:hypothetical protein